MLQPFSVYLGVLGWEDNDSDVETVQHTIRISEYSFIRYVFGFHVVGKNMMYLCCENLAIRSHNSDCGKSVEGEFKP